jgi:hypothetical protein
MDALWVGPVGEFAWCWVTWPPFVDPPYVGPLPDIFVFILFLLFVFIFLFLSGW